MSLKEKLLGMVMVAKAEFSKRLDVTIKDGWLPIHAQASVTPDAKEGLDVGISVSLSIDGLLDGIEIPEMVERCPYCDHEVYVCAEYMSHVKFSEDGERIIMIKGMTECGCDCPCPILYQDGQWSIQ